MTLDLPSSPLLDIALVVEDLPLELAERVQEVQEKNPELLRQFLVYCFTRKAIFDTLATKLAR